MKKLLQSLFILCTLTVAAFAQDRVVTGTIVANEDGSPIPGASVRVKEVPSVTVVTGADGKFSFRVPAAGKTLTIFYIGFTSKDVAIPANNNVGVVRLTADVTMLNDVVVTAGGVSIQRREQGNQSTTVKARELTQGKSSNVAGALSGKVAGLQVNAVSSGVNPSVRLVLRGNRSLLGNNQALVVVDNVIVPSSILGNLNPEDVEDIQVLNGAGAAALYGSDASNGALIITTKSGKNGVTQIKVGQTSSMETISYLPKTQKRFGSGTGPDDIPTYTPYENQQYGPEFDGAIVDLGKPLVDGSIQKVPYSYNSKENKDAFWETGRTSQTDFNMTSGDEKGSYYLSSQYYDQKGTVPGDKFNRFTVRVNGNKDLGRGVSFGFNVNYVQNRYDLGDSGTAFNNVLMSPGQVPLTRYKNWRTDLYATPDTYYNEYYDSPYFTLGNARNLTRNDYLTGTANIKYNPIKPLTLLFRVSMSTRNVSTNSWSDKYVYSDYRKKITSNFSDRAGSVSAGQSFETQLSPEFQAQYIKKLSQDFSLNAILGASLRDNVSKSVNAGSSAMVVQGIYNVSNTTGNTSGSEGKSRTRQMGVYADVRFGYKGFLYLHGTARNDWRSVLSEANRSLFYPAADISFIASEALSFLKESKVISSLKLRGGLSKVGQVNIGAYALSPTFGQAAGYPYSGVPGFAVGSRVVAPDIKPELTTSAEVGFDLEMLKSRVVVNASVYKSKTIDQTVPVGLPSSSGFTSFLTNTGEVKNKGLETALRVVPIRTASGFEVSVGGNYTVNANEVVSISGDLPSINLGTFGTAVIVAQEGQPFPLLKGTSYTKDAASGKIIVNPVTGFPTNNTTIGILGLTDPKHRLGLDLSASYKGLRFATVFEYRTGNVIYTGASTGFDFSGAGIRTTYFNRERFVVPNSVYLDPATNTYVENTNITVRTGGVDFWTNGPSNTAVNANYTYSAAFWKMREASLSYQLPKSVIRNVKFLKGAEISVQGRNLFLWAPKSNLYTDPEYSALGSGSNAVGFTSLSETPPGRYYGFSLSLTL